MRAWLATSQGPPAEVLELGSCEPPRPGPGQVSVRVELGGINFADRMLIEGRYQERFEPPFIAGTEVVGWVEEAGAGVTLSPGQRVAGFAGAPSGGYAEVALAAEAGIFAIPEELDATVALQLPVAYVTAWMGLHHAGRVAGGERVLVTAAAGALGQALVRLAVAAGAELLALVGSEAKLAACERAGARWSFVYDDPRLGATIAEQLGGGADLLLDSVGGGVWEECVRRLRPGGRAVVLGFSSGVIPQQPLNRLLLKNIAVGGLFVGGYLKTDPQLVRAAFEAVLGVCLRGEVQPDRVAEVPLEELPQALDRLASRATTGKLALRWADPPDPP